MYCNKCGKEVEENSKFCNNCGEKTNNIGNIIFARKKQFYGIVIPIKVFLDGNLVATIGAGNEAKIPTTIGKHKIAFNLWSGNGIYDIEIKPENPDIKVEFKLGVGLVTSKPKIVSITNM